MEIVRQGRDTMLVAGVPQKRGTPVHFEHQDSTAFTGFDPRTFKVTEIHTPPVAVIRIHELMHARHTNQRTYKKMYASVPDSVAQTLEDVRIHVLHWPWKGYGTPQSVTKAALDYMAYERASFENILTDQPKYRGGWEDFSGRLRQVAVIGAINHGDYYVASCDADFVSDEQRELAMSIIDAMQCNDGAKAAHIVGTVFGFIKPKLPKPDYYVAGGGGPGWVDDPDTTIPIITINGFEQPEMRIIELPKTEHCEGSAIGMRRATMGSRMYRPALRRPLLPQRLFLRRTPVEPGGTILIDASGSMGSFDVIKQWAEKAPFGTIAYYAGDGGRGWLWIYARDGRRAAEVAEPEHRGNTVDGPALTWLMTQPAPRTFVTDRGFCDAQDSELQKARLSELERTGEVVVVNYNKKDDDD
jgi:hypothetical protein